MTLYYNAVDGEIFYAVPDRDANDFTHTTNIPLSTLYIDETPNLNKSLRDFLRRKATAKDANGLSRYYVQLGKIVERLDWVEQPPKFT